MRPRASEDCLFTVIASARLLASLSQRKDVCVGAYLSSRAASSQVLSAQVSLTAVFGMGTGVPSPSSAPTGCNACERCGGDP